MPRRHLVFANKEIYHVYNRSTASEEIFIGKREQDRVLDLFDYYRFEQKISFSKYKNLSRDRMEEYKELNNDPEEYVSIFAFSLMPDHFHILLKQLEEKGIQQFISNFQNGYAKYFNTKFERRGSLFQNPFKAKRIGTNEELLHVSRYIHLNPVTAYIVGIDELPNHYPNSFREYVKGDGLNMINTKDVLSIIGSSGSYTKFVNDQADYQRKLQRLKKLGID